MKTTRIMIVAVGGQGNILAARVLGEAAAASGIPFRMSEFHGMAQRGGVVESMVLLGDGKGYCIADGEADVLLGFEPSETIRAARKCSSRSMIITSTSELPPFTVAMGQDQYPDVTNALKTMAGHVSRLITLDAASLALQAGSAQAANMVMLGALAGSRVLPIDLKTFREMIRTRTKPQFAEINLIAFDLGTFAVNFSSTE
ncbi:MAG: indolepyruvate oxidoreductase subunit beta [Oceanipulchritudo sp.]